MNMFLIPSGSVSRRLSTAAAVAGSAFVLAGCKDAAADLQVRVTTLQEELAKTNREVERTQKEMARVQEEAEAKVKAATNVQQPPASASVASSGLSREELDTALQAAFSRFKSDLAANPTSVVSVPRQPVVENTPQPPVLTPAPTRPPAGGPSLPANETRAVDWGDKRPPVAPKPGGSPIQRQPGTPPAQPPAQPPRTPSNLPPANQEVPIKF